MYSELVSSYQQTFSSFVGPGEVPVIGETLQINDLVRLTTGTVHDGSFFAVCMGEIINLFVRVQ